MDPAGSDYETFLLDPMLDAGEYNGSAGHLAGISGFWTLLS